MTQLTTKLALIATLSCLLLSGCSRQAIVPVAQAQTPETKTVSFQANVAPKTDKKKEHFYCGAPTKDGHPCKHVVKKQGDHCWQHGG